MHTDMYTEMLEIKTTKTKIKNDFVRLISKLDITVTRVSDSNQRKS